MWGGVFYREVELLPLPTRSDRDQGKLAFDPIPFFRKTRSVTADPNTFFGIFQYGTSLVLAFPPGFHFHGEAIGRRWSRCSVNICRIRRIDKRHYILYLVCSDVWCVPYIVYAIKGL